MISLLCSLSTLLKRCASISFSVTGIVVGVIMTRIVGGKEQELLFVGGWVKGVAHMCWLRDVSRSMH